MVPGTFLGVEELKRIARSPVLRSPEDSAVPGMRPESESYLQGDGASFYRLF
ncbi:MAG: hypothetical protein LBL56_01320 [Treponema sp.]|nr:hypothetical protein [Treponema sp.]